MRFRWVKNFHAHTECYGGLDNPLAGYFALDGGYL